MPVELDQQTLLSLVHYDPESGKFTWLKRPETSVAIKTWNGRFAGSVAGSFDDRGYWRIKLFGCSRKAHQLAWLYMFGELPVTELDHINRARSDNRISNLRLVTRSQNVRNTSLKSTNKTGVVGVSWYKKGKKWQVQISVGGRRDSKRVHHIGYFDDFEEAKSAYNTAYLEHSKNFPIYVAAA